MNADELMIGDWVEWMHPEHKETRGIYKISSILDDCVEFIDEQGMHCYQPFSEIYPLLLTAEIIEENGWKKEDVFGSLIKYRFVGPIDIETGGEMFRLSNNYFFCSGIHYVHELQRALRMCGVEKDITI